MPESLPNGISSGLIGLGLVLVAIGLIARFGLFDWIGHLPGDIRIERPGTRIFIPVMSMIVLSGLLTLILNLLAWWIGGRGK